MCGQYIGQRYGQVLLRGTVSSPQVGFPKVGSPEIGFPKVDTVEIDSEEFGTTEVSSPEVGFPKVSIFLPPLVPCLNTFLEDIKMLLVGHTMYSLQESNFLYIVPLVHYGSETVMSHTNE